VDALYLHQNNITELNPRCLELGKCTCEHQVFQYD